MFDCQTSFCYFTLCLKCWARQESLSMLSSISPPSPNQKLQIKSAEQDSQNATLWQHTLQLPNTSQAARAASFHEISYCLLKAAAMNLSTIKEAEGFLRCLKILFNHSPMGLPGQKFRCIPPPRWSIDGSQTVYSVFIHLWYDHSQLNTFASQSLAVYTAEPLQHVETMLFTLSLCSWLHTGK